MTRSIGTIVAAAVAMALCSGAVAAKEENGMAEQAVKLTTSDGVTLEARLAEPAGWQPQDGAVVVCHPHPLYGGTMDNAIVVRVCRALAAAGIAALRFNFRGVGASGGEYGEGKAEVNDVLAAVRYLVDQKNVPETRLAVVGYSFGSAVAAAALSRVSALVAYVGIALPVDRSELGGKLRGLLEPRRPVLLVAAANDQIAPPDRALAVALARRGVTRIEVVGEASHFFTEITQREAVSAAIVNFLREQWQAQDGQ